MKSAMVLQREVEQFLGNFSSTRDGRRFVDGVLALERAESQDERVDALHDLVVWSRLDRALPPPLAADDMPEAFQRFSLLIEIFEKVPGAQAVMDRTVADLLLESSVTHMIASAGLPTGRGFMAEASDRLMAKVVPVPREDHDLGHICVRTFRHPAEVRRIGRMPPELFARLIALVTPQDRPELIVGLWMDFADGLRLLGTRVRAAGLHEKIRERSSPCRIEESPFFRLSHCVDELAVLWSRSETDSAQSSQCLDVIEQCRKELAEVSRRIEASGVSVDIVYGTDLIERCMVRIEQMIGIADAQTESEFARRLHTFFAQLIIASYRDRSVRQLLSDTTGLLGRKVVERNGRSGEHYVARNASEYRHIWVAAAGGGIVAGLMGALKFPVIEADHAAFVEGLLLTAVYIGGFLVMQAFGLILATKQPAMFGATIADIVRKEKDSVVELAILARRILHSQLAATISNLILVSLTAFAVAAIWYAQHGEPYLTQEEALHTYRTLDPLGSGTIFYAALTGVLLWVASVAGGFLDNWSVYHRVPQGIADHPLGRVVGRERMVRFAGAWSRRVADIGTNVTLGILLGMTPIIGEFLGVPLDVRHVTLSTGKFMLGAASLGSAWYEDGLIWSATAGVAIMFVLNLGVGFVLALYIALRAYGLPRRYLFTVLAHFVKRTDRQPAPFDEEGAQKE